MKPFIKLFSITMIIGLASIVSSKAAIYINDDFNTFANANLVGQNSWNQGPGAASTLPLQVNNGLVVIPGAHSTDNQDAYKDIGTGIAQPGSGTTTVYAAFSLAVQSSPAIPGGTLASPSYFAAVTTATAGGGFANFRVTTETNSPTAFQIGARVTGQGTDPFTYGAGLAYGVTNEVVLEYNMVAGAGGSYMRIFINPSNLSTPYLTHVIGAGSSDPTGAGSFNISQFASGTVGNSGVTIDHLVVADSFSEVIPEPSSVALVGCGLLGLLATYRRKK